MVGYMAGIGVVCSAIGGLKGLEKTVRKVGGRRAAAVLNKVCAIANGGDIVSLAQSAISKKDKIKKLMKNKNYLQAAIKTAGGISAVRKEVKRIYGL